MATMKRTLIEAVNLNVFIQIEKPIHGGQLILVIQQPSTEWISPTDEIIMVWRNSNPFQACWVLPILYTGNR